MYSVSTAFRNDLAVNDNRNFKGSCTITLKNGTVLSITNANIWDGGFKVEDSVSGSGTFDVGSAIIQKFTLMLNNIYDTYSDYDFTGARVTNVRVALRVTGNTSDTYVSKGVYTVESATGNDIITLTCLDNMYKFDRPYSESKLTYPATVYQIVSNACTCCGVSLANNSLTFEHSNYVIKKRPDNDDFTFREVLCWLGQITAHWFKCDTSGKLTVGWYNSDNLDAGTNVHEIRGIDDITPDADDVVITGVKIITDNDGSNSISYQYGSDGYVITVENNRFINNENVEEIGEMLGKRIIGLQFRPLSMTCLPDPTMESGDGAIVYDRKNKVYKTFITTTVFSLGDNQQVDCDAESPMRMSSGRFSATTKIYREFRRQIDAAKTEWQKSMEELEKKMGEEKGLFPVIKTLSDGSKQYYLCDRSTLEDSSVVFELNGNGWAVSTDGGSHWNAGLTVDGTMITQILNTVGINAGWINTGSLTVKDAKGNETFFVDTATGAVRIKPTSFSIEGQSVSDIANATVNSFINGTYSSDLSSLQAQIDGNIETFYYNYTPTLNNIPASNWKTEDDRKKHEGDLFYDKSKGYAYRFYKDGSTWKWVLIQDTDITSAIAKAEEAKGVADSAVTRITAVEGNITSEVSRATAEEAAIRSLITQTESSINISVENVRKTAIEKNGNYYGNYIPTTSNAPAINWGTSAKASHVGDFFYNTSTGFAYRYVAKRYGFKVKFSSDSRTENVSYDYVEIFYEKDSKIYSVGKIGGTDIAGAEILVPAPNGQFWVYWHTDGSSSNYYGFKIDSVTGTTGIEINGEEKALPNYTVTTLANGTYPQSSHNGYGDNVNQLWKCTTGTTGSTTISYSWVRVKDQDIDAEVSRATAAENALQAQITVNADAIMFKVDSGDVESIIEQKADSIRLKASKISWSSTYSSMTQAGVLTCTGADIKGTIKTKNYGSWGSAWLLLDDAMIKGGSASSTPDSYIDFSANYADGAKAMAISSRGSQGLRLQKSGTDKMVINGNVAMYCTLNMNGYTITNQSDNRLKENIERNDKRYFKALRNIHVHRFDWKDGHGHVEAGFIAQEMQRYLPDLVQPGEDGYLTINQIGLIPYMWNMIQELERRTRKNG